jgi:hypothetical protein
MHFFEDVQAVLFIAAINEYDQTLYEDEGQNRVSEALQLFADTCAVQMFERTSMILFLNKLDLFQEKLQRVDLSVRFPEYVGKSKIWFAIFCVEIVEVLIKLFVCLFVERRWKRFTKSIGLHHLAVLSMSQAQPSSLCAFDLCDRHIKHPQSL